MLELARRDRVERVELDGALYVSEQGFGFPAGQGRVIRVTVG